jgi:hypothetical protein
MPSLTLLAVLILASMALRAQDAPATVGTAGSGGLAVSGTLSYSLRYSEASEIDGPQGSQQQSYVSGDASYSDTNKRYPFSLQYGGGYGWFWAGPPSAGNIFQHLSLSQGATWRSWNLSASDSVSYSFQTPTTGFAGVPGTGETIGAPVSTTPTDQTILTVNTRTLDNMTTIAAGHRLDHATSLSFGGAASQLHFIDNNGQDSNTLTADASLSRRLDARDSASVSYAFSRFNFGGSVATLAGAPQITSSQANSLQIGFNRQWNGKISTSGSIGPQWVSTSNSALVPSSTYFTASAMASELFKFGSASIYYSRGTSGGAGYMLGAEDDAVGGNFSRKAGKNMSIGITGSYMRTSALVAEQLVYNAQGVLYLIPLSITPTTNAKFGGVQATRKLGRYWNAFANYTIVDQTSNVGVAVTGTQLGYKTNILNGLSQVIGFGIGYSPRELHFKR